MTNLKISVILTALLSSSLAAPVLDSIRAANDWTTKSYDAIVVGAGTAGIIVAERLSEAGKNVLLLEQGGPSYGITGGTEKPSWLSGTNLSRVDVPGLYSTIFGTASNTLMCKSGVVGAYAACTLGGNSAINAGLYFQPPASDWDTFFPTGWKSADVVNATNKLLSVQPEVTSYSADNKYYLQTGYNAALKWLVTNGGFANVDINAQANNKKKVFGRTQYNYRNGQRGGPVTTYLQTALKRSNFMLQTGVIVQNITRNGATATGVRATVNGATTTIKLNTGGRVVLSGGAMLSPGLLMKSGIGPSDQLTALAAKSQIGASSTWVTNANVGQGLFDNPNTFIELSGPAVQAYSYSYSNPPASDSSAYLNSKTGPYSFAGQTSVFWDYITNSDGSQTGVQGTLGTGGYQDYTNASTITLNVYGTSGMASSSRVTISTDGKYTPGAGSSPYYTNPRDATAIATFIHNIFQALPGSGLTPLNFAQSGTVAQIQKNITTYSPYTVGAVQHWTSSCRIGSCVDVNTTVIGTSNVHVVDASIIAPPTVNPQMMVMIAAEHAAEKILALK